MTQLDFIHKSLEIKTPPDFTVISTFSGCGGSSTGYVWAGGKVLLAVEWDKNAVDTYRLNYPNTPIYHGDIAKLSVKECLKLTGLKVGELDILDGSPPCQGFSTAGKRNMDDERNQLFREYVRLLKGLQPKVFVMENVSGMVKGKMKLLFAEILTELKACGYNVSAKLLNAMYLGVPQSRERMIFIGVRNDLGIAPSHPKPMTKKVGVTLDTVFDESLFLSPAKQAQAEAHKKRHAERGNGFKYGVIENGKPSRTIQKNMIIGDSLRIVMVGNRMRMPSLSELKQIGSYPNCYQFLNYEDSIERIGNSVPPEMMRRIAEHIRDTILNETTNGKTD